MATPSAQYSLRLHIEMERGPGSLGRVATAIGATGGAIGSINVIEAGQANAVRDVIVDCTGPDAAADIVEALEALGNVKLLEVTDRTLELHRGGKLFTGLSAELNTRDDLSMAYTPGVARVCSAIADDPSKAFEYTIKQNTVAVVTDGSAVLGLGDIGPAAAMPVMEGKAALFKAFGGVDAFPICLDTKDPDEIVEIVKAMAPGFGGINLEDISSPRCFEIERRLRDALDIPVFHDDQHGTAICVLAALTNALRVVGKNLADVKVVVSGAGAAGTAIMKLLLRQGVGDIIAYDRQGALHRGMADLNPTWQWLAENTNSDNYSGDLAGAIAGADVFIGVSAPNLLSGADIAKMADKSIVFALANPDPEVDPREARQHAAIVATGRSDQPNQINNVLAFPGVFRGMLDVSATEFTEEMALAAARAIADVVGVDKLNPTVIVPSVFDPRVTPAVAAALRAVARGAAPAPHNVAATPEVELEGAPEETF